MIELFYNEETGQYWEVDLVRLRWLGRPEEANEPDADFEPELEYLADHDWYLVSPLTVKMIADSQDDGVGSPRKDEGESLLKRLEQMVARVESVPPEALSFTEAARFLGVEIRSLEYLVKIRKIRYIQVGDQRVRVFRIADLRDFLDMHMVRTAEEELRRLGRRPCGSR
jgi:predicted HTH domain antitoxin